MSPPITPFTVWEESRDKFVEIARKAGAGRLGTYAILRAILIQLKILSAQLEREWTRPKDVPRL